MRAQWRTDIREWEERVQMGRGMKERRKRRMEGKNGNKYCVIEEERRIEGRETEWEK